MEKETTFGYTPMAIQPETKGIIIETKKLCKSFSLSGKQHHVIKNLDLQINRGDFTVIMGSSGSGKTTLLYALSGMDKPTLGDIFFEEENIANLNNDQLAVFRRNHCGFLFQNIHLLNYMNGFDNVLASGLIVNKNKQEVSQKARTLLEQMGLQENVWKEFPSQMSGGEAQRIGIVRALINDPQMIFADEPTGALNSSAGNAVLDVLSDIHKKGNSIVMVTHDMKTAARGNRILYLRDGIVFGELHLGDYDHSGISDRMGKLQKFLDEMGW